MKVKIISPTEAKEINPLGDKPYYIGNPFLFKKKNYENDLEKWKRAEAACKTYRIEKMPCHCGKRRDIFLSSYICDCVNYSIGSIHNATIISEGVVKIID